MVLDMNKIQTIVSAFILAIPFSAIAGISYIMTDSIVNPKASCDCVVFSYDGSVHCDDEILQNLEGPATPASLPAFTRAQIFYKHFKNYRINNWASSIYFHPNIFSTPHTENPPAHHPPATSRFQPYIFYQQALLPTPAQHPDRWKTRRYL